MKISTSIGDFPIFKNIEDSFAKAKATGVDGVELVMGFRSRWQFPQILRLSHKYKLPITSVHQPYWSGLGIAYDEGFISMLVKEGITRIVLHPLCFQSMHSKKMQEYFAFFSHMQRKYHITVMLENMPCEEGFFSLDRWVVHKNTSDISTISSAAERYGFSLTYDVSHTEWTRPQEHEEFTKVLPLIQNIHLSSFDTNKQHLPLIIGKFETKSFIQFLLSKNYKGLLTFEIFYPKQFPFFNFDWEGIKKSVDLIHSVADKSS